MFENFVIFAKRIATLSSELNRTDKNSQKSQYYQIDWRLNSPEIHRTGFFCKNNVIPRSGTSKGWLWNNLNFIYIYFSNPEKLRSSYLRASLLFFILVSVGLHGKTIGLNLHFNCACLHRRKHLFFDYPPSRTHALG